MNLTLPSPNAKFAPPGWLLLALTKLEPSGAHPRQPPKRQLCQGYCLELGGTTVLNRVQPRSPWAQIWPVYCLSPVVSPVERAAGPEHVAGLESLVDRGGVHFRVV